MEFIIDLLTPLFIALGLVNPIVEIPEQVQPDPIYQEIIELREKVKQLEDKEQEISEKIPELEPSVNIEPIEAKEVQVITPPVQFEREVIPTTGLPECGSSAYKMFRNTPTFGLCNVGTPSQVTKNANTYQYNWRCETQDQGFKNCLANAAREIPECGVERGSIIDEIDKEKLCPTSNAIFNEVNGYVDWECGSVGHDPVNCSALLKVDAVCGGKLACRNGTPGDVTLDDQYKKEWTCEGYNGGASKECTWIDTSNPEALGCKEVEVEPCGTICAPRQINYYGWESGTSIYGDDCQDLGPNYLP